MRYKDAVDKLTKNDTISLLLFILYKLRNDPDYLLLSEMPLLVQDTNSLLALFKYYGGMKITIPTIDELCDLLTVLDIYNEVNLKGNKEYLKDINLNANALKIYSSLDKILEEYKFKR